MQNQYQYPAEYDPYQEGYDPQPPPKKEACASCCAPGSMVLKVLLSFNLIFALTSTTQQAYLFVINCFTRRYHNVFPAYSLTGVIATIVGEISLSVNTPTTATAGALNQSIGPVRQVENGALDWSTYRALHVSPMVEFFILVSNLMVIVYTIMFLASLFDDWTKPSAILFANLYKWIHFLNPAVFTKFFYLIYAGVSKEIRAVNTWKEGVATLFLVWFITLVWCIVNGVAGMLYSNARTREANQVDYQDPDEGY